MVEGKVLLLDHRVKKELGIVGIQHIVILSSIDLDHKDPVVHVVKVKTQMMTKITTQTEEGYEVNVKMTQISVRMWTLHVITQVVAFSMWLAFLVLLHTFNAPVPHMVVGNSHYNIPVTHTCNPQPAH